MNTTAQQDRIDAARIEPWLRNQRQIGVGSAFPLTAEVPGGLQDNDRFFRSDQGLLYRYISAAWQIIGGRGIGVLVYNSIAIAIANATVTALTFDSERYDTDTQHDTAVNASRLTCVYAGVYTISGTIRWASNATGVRAAQIRLNGGAFIGSVAGPATSGDVTDQSVGALYSLAAGDYVELCAYQTSGGSLNVSAFSSASPQFGMQRIG